MKILWHSNAPFNTSAYGQQTALFVPRINTSGHEVAAIAAPYTFGGAVLEWESIPLLPSVRDVAGTDVIAANYDYFKADLMISLCDPFRLLAAAGDLAQINWAPWFPVDCEPLSSPDVTVLREGQGIPIAMSRFGERVLRDEGAEPMFCPHAVDTQVFCPGDPEPYRETVPGIGPDTFVIGICAMNRGRRKGFDQQLLAFSRFHARHPDSFLALHTAPVGPSPSVNLPGLAAQLGISGAVAFPEAYLYDTGQITAGMMAAWYRGLDVLSLCSYGEGFGVPLIEAQACGTPVICTDGSAMSELCGAGWVVSSTPDWEDGHCAWWRRPDAEDIEQAYEAAWQAREDGMLPKKAARDFGELFDIDRVFQQYMVPVLKELENRIG
jgi:glycosyltransferase involved in cell wall biosynthesis